MNSQNRWTSTLHMRPWPLKLSLERGRVIIPIEVSGLGGGKQESVPKFRGASWGGAVRWGSGGMGCDGCNVLEKKVKSSKSVSQKDVFLGKLRKQRMNCKYQWSHIMN